jgi:hypothetical protein
MRSRAASVEQYLVEVPTDRQEAMRAVRSVILARLPTGFEEGMQHGMIGYYVPVSRFADTPSGQPLDVAALANQKRYMALYLMGVYADPGEAWWFRDRWLSSGKKLDMGKGCVRFRRLADVPIEVVGEAISRASVDDVIGAYQRSRGDR